MRLRASFVSADARRSRASLEKFQSAVSGSEAVIAMHLMPLASLIEAPGGMVSTFYGMVESGARLPNSGHDVLRGVLDQTVNPLGVHEQIRFAALSLNREGLAWFGPIFVTLAEDAIAGRASVFEENPLTFFDHKGLSAHKPIPPGYRASWARRGDLAAAKLHAKVSPLTNEDEFAGILMEQGSTSDSADYIEVHIYGAIMPKAFASVRTRNVARSDQSLWKRVRRKLSEYGSEVVEL